MDTICENSLSNAGNSSPCLTTVFESKLPQQSQNLREHGQGGTLGTSIPVETHVRREVATGAKPPRPRDPPEQMGQMEQPGFGYF